MGQASTGTGEQTLRRCMGHHEFEPGPAGSVRSSLRGEKSRPQPIAPAVSRSARVIQAPSRTRQAALLYSREAQPERPKEEKEVGAARNDGDLLTFVASGRGPSQSVGGSTNGPTNSHARTIVGSQPVDLKAIVGVDRTVDRMLPKQMLYQAELRPDRAGHGIRFASRCNAMHRDATEIPAKLGPYVDLC